MIGTPDGAAAMRRVLSRLEQDDLVWVTDTGAILKACGVPIDAFRRPQDMEGPPSAPPHGASTIATRLLAGTRGVSTTSVST